MRKYTFRKLINSLIHFEEELYRYLSMNGFDDLAQKSRRRLDALRDASQVIIVEMTLEPIYTVDISKVLSEVYSTKDGEAIETLVNGMYREVSKALENVSTELADLLRSFL